VSSDRLGRTGDRAEGPVPPDARDPASSRGLAEAVPWLVRARHVLTAGPAGHVRDGALAVRGDRIAAVGPWAELRRAFPDAEVVGDGSGILTPGFVSCHGHFSEGLITGIGETYTLWEWLVRIITPVQPHLTRELALVGTLLKGAEAALSGVTTVADMFCHAPGPEPAVPGVVEALDRLGLRGDVSYGASDQRNPRPLDRVLSEHEALAGAAAVSRRTRYRVGLASVPSASDELIGATAKLVGEVGRLHVHFHEVREEVTQVRGTRGVDSIEYAARTGLLDGQTVAAHCVWVDDRDIALLRDHDVAVAHNPVSNMILASGVCPVPRLLRENVPVGLGLDGPASNDSQDMLETMKVSALLQKVHHLQATAMTAPEVLRMATLGGARALGIDAEVGSLDPGKAADLVLFGERSPSLSNIHDPYQELVYCASVRDVEQVWVAGERVVAGGQVLGLDLPELLPHARELAVKLAVDAGLDSELARAGPPQTPQEEP
jgi:cytosine/adenosine deaminase-related metal-dependent hydrolase